jgi:hypothetical protein
MNPARTTFLPDTYRFSWPDEGVEVLVDRLTESKSDLLAEVTVRTAAPFPGLLRQAKFNLSSTRVRNEWIRTLSERGLEVDWYAIIEQVCTLSLRRWREGSPIIDLAQVEPREDDAYLLRPYIVEGAASGLFADGGVGKSLFALAAALTLATGQPILGVVPSRICSVLYLDWEWDQDAHAERLLALCEGAGIEVPRDRIWYRREIASINETAPSIRRQIVEKGIGLVIIDSLGFARGGEPESADLTIRTFASFRSFGVPTLFIDHIAKHSTDRQHSFGSVYTRNSARLMWRIDAEEQDQRGTRRLGLVNTKWNRSHQKPRGLLLTTETDTFDHLVLARFDDCDPPLVTVRAGGIKEALIALLRQNEEGLNLADIQSALEIESVKVTRNVLHATLGRKANRNVFTYQDGKWHLASNLIPLLSDETSNALPNVTGLLPVQ